MIYIGDNCVNSREELRNKSRIVIKIGSSSLFHMETGKMDFGKIDKLARIISDLSNSGRDMILVSSGAQATAKSSLGLSFESGNIPARQACAAIGQAQLITIYQKLFAEYGKTVAQVLLTRYTIHSELTRNNATNTFNELIRLGAIPIVNENDTVTTEEIEFGDNDCLSAMVAVLTDADLLIILSDIDGLYDDNPKENPDAKFISDVYGLDNSILNMGKSTTGTQFGTGGMASKLEAARITEDAGIDMLIVNGSDLDNISRVLDGENVGTFFHAGKGGKFEFEEFDIKD